MDDKLFEELEKLGIADTDLLLNEEMNLSLDTLTRKRIERSVKKKAGFYASTNTLSGRINDYLGGIYMKRKIALALSAVAVLGLGGGGYAYAKTPVAYVSVDINPSVELGVNAFDQVVSVEAYNEDGEKVLEGTDLINTNVDDAVSAVITNAISDGYIEEDDAITTDETATTSAAVEITVSTDKDGIADKLNESLKETADQTLENNNVDAEVETNKVALARRDEARQLGITPGKLNLIQKLQALDPEIKVEDYKSSSVKDIQKKTKELRKMKTSSETTTDSNAVTDITTDTNTDANATSTNTDVTTDGNTEQEEAVVAKPSVDSAAIAVPGKNKNSSSEKTSNGIIKKEENSTTGSVKKEENSNNGSVKKEENAAKKEEKSGAASEKNSDSSHGNGNSSKSEKSGNGNSSSENKGKGKNN
ncbi:anti-sigma-I factor RsgI family protein [Clostridium chromiireducens]|uniref:Anti-sigma-I factor RsgI n=1 Tax=Clostridium chromiireducens TaxID=225345 RepID=A0A1V4IKS1_9CLOT|nr:hypothetical protein [Clostridium chromiireducens]OPJ60430.1 anti-sigma-I factor RsgI [Clostridium chromiireducens]